MGLFNKIFKSDKPQGGTPGSSREDDDESTGEPGSKSAPRRELVHVVLRDTVRQHAIPSDWIECELLSVVNASDRAGLHVHLIVRRAHEQLLPYVPAFQSSFMDGMARFDPRFGDWLFGLSWQFEGMRAQPGQGMPSPGAWSGAASAAAPPANAPADFESTQDDIEDDLKKLFAIRDAALQAPDPLPKAKEPPRDFQETQPGH